MGEVIELSSDSSSDTVLTPATDELNINDPSFDTAFKAFDEIDNILKKYNNFSGDKAEKTVSESLSNVSNDDYECSLKKSDTNNSKSWSISDLHSASSKTDEFGSASYSQFGVSTSDNYNNFRKYSSTDSDLDTETNTLNKSSKYELDDFDDEFYFHVDKKVKGSVFKSNVSIENSSQNTDTASLDAESDGSSQKFDRESYKISRNNTKQKDKEASRIEKMKERERKKEEQQREKALKQALQNANRNLKPDQAMKFIKVHIDGAIMNAEYGPEIVTALGNADVAYSVQSQIIPNTITWTRKIQSQLIDDDGKLSLSDENRETDELVVIVNWKEFIELIASNSLTTHIQSIKSVFPNKKMSLALYGLQRYHNYQRNVKRKEFRDQLVEAPQGNVRDTNLYKDVPQLSKQEIDNVLTELQILCNLSFRRLETKHDVGLFVAQITKAVAQLPYKLEKQKTHMQANWYMSGDNKDCVKVDKDGNGLNRLWHQQLTTFPLARLETAEAIASRYATPTSLMQAYDETQNEEEAQFLLQDIPIRRAAGPLTTVRKIGPELSKKIYKFFTTLDGNCLL